MNTPPAVRYAYQVTDSHPAEIPRPCPPRRGEEAFAEDVDARLGNYVKQAEQALIAAKSEALRPFDLTVAQYAAMMALYYSPGQSSAQLARAAAVTPQTMATTLSKLEGKKLIKRSPSKLHRKVLVVELTADGESLVLRADEHARAIEERLADAFTADEHVAARSLLRRITEVLRGGDNP